VILSRILVPLLGILVWTFFYLNAVCAYRLARGTRRTASMLALVFGSMGILFLQVTLMEHLSPGDAHSHYFDGLVMVEWGGALVVLFSTLLREKARSKRL
jgi:hypothetical protein